MEVFTFRKVAQKYKVLRITSDELDPKMIAEVVSLVSDKSKFLFDLHNQFFLHPGSILHTNVAQELGLPDFIVEDAGKGLIAYGILTLGDTSGSYGGSWPNGSDRREKLKNYFAKNSNVIVNDCRSHIW